MTEEIQIALDEARDGMNKSISHLEVALTKIRAGRATPSMLDTVRVDYYGAPTALSQVANISILDARTISVQPWEKSLLDEISRGIINANLGLNPQNNGEVILLSVPMLTEERRRDLVKTSKSEGEHAKVGIRNSRKDANDFIKSLGKDGLSEDMQKSAEDDIQKITNDFVAKIEALLVVKEKDIMTV